MTMSSHSSMPSTLQDEVYAITDVKVTDDLSEVPIDYTGVSDQHVTLPYIPEQEEGEKVAGVDVNHGIGGTNTTIWVKYQRLPRDSSTPVLVELEVRHWVHWKASLPPGNEWKYPTGRSAGRLTTGTKGPVWRNGLVVRYLPLRDAENWVLALYLSVTSSSTPSPPPAEPNWPPSADTSNKVLTLKRCGIDIHRGGGGHYYYVMAYSFADTMTVLTYNTHLFTHSNADTFNDVENFFKKILGGTKRRLVYEDNRRATLIADRIRQSGADIVGLQEVWSTGRQTWFCEQLSDVYPYSYYAPQMDPRPIIIPDGIDPQDVDLRIGSGLVLLSKYKLIDPSFAEFPREFRFTDFDCWARKGVIAAMVELSPHGMMLRVGICQAHTDAGDKDPLKQPNISLLIGETVREPYPALMMGDFNINGNKEDEYGAMESKFKAARAANAYMKVWPTVTDRDYTTDFPNNCLDQYFTAGPRPGRVADRLDYLFLKESGGDYLLEPVEAEVPRDWQFEVKPGKARWDLSDHFPVKVKFALARRPKSVKR
jgi:endonuclease/exonuclease/phosphatase family metal-dependent hydrolase